MYLVPRTQALHHPSCVVSPGRRGRFAFLDSLLLEIVTDLSRGSLPPATCRLTLSGTCPGPCPVPWVGAQPCCRPLGLGRLFCPVNCRIFTGYRQNVSHLCKVARAAEGPWLSLPGSISPDPATCGCLASPLRSPPLSGPKVFPVLV